MKSNSTTNSWKPKGGTKIDYNKIVTVITIPSFLKPGTKKSVPKVFLSLYYYLQFLSKPASKQKLAFIRFVNKSVNLAEIQLSTPEI